MRKIVAGLAVVCFLALAGPAGAQGLGVADPLSLATHAVLVPFFGSGGNLSFLEIASPVGDNTNPDVHLIFFNFACVRGESFNNPMTKNDFDIIRAGGPALPFLSNTDGLILITGSFDGLTPVALKNAIHTRVLWVSAAQDFIRAIDPIIGRSATNPAAVWSPFVSAATFWAPQETASAQTTVYLVCPLTTVTGVANFAIEPVPPPDPPVQSQIRGVVYDHDETPLRDITTSCSCLTPRRLFDLSLAYTTTDTYTELFGLSPPNVRTSFTGYVGTVFGGTAFDLFHRMSNAFGAQIQ